jgi:hypothetical protein
MHYENFEKAADLVKQIRSYESALEDLNKNPVVIISCQSGPRIYTISTASDSEHEYKNQSVDFITDIQADLERRKRKLIVQLNAL